MFHEAFHRQGQNVSERSLTSRDAISETLKQEGSLPASGRLATGEHHLVTETKSVNISTNDHFLLETNKLLTKIDTALISGCEDENAKNARIWRPFMKQGLGIVVGAGGGIGQAVSMYMLEHFEKVLLIDADQKLIDDLLSKIAHDTAANNLYKEIVDITDYQSVKDTIDRYAHQHTLSALINCAGISIDGTSTLSYQDFHDMMQVNVFGNFNVISAALPYFKKENKGHIISLVSQSGKRARPKTGGYAASKFALMGYLEALQKELSNTNIQITALCPGMTNTRQTDDEPDVPKDVMVQPADLVSALHYLLSIPHNISIKELIIECKYQITYMG